MSGQTEAITFTYDREYEPAILAAAGRMFGRPGEGPSWESRALRPGES